MAKYDNFSREELIELLQKQDKELARKKYGLVWDSEKEPEQVVLDCAKKLPILKSIAEKDIKTNDDDYNIMIEGDNYHALQVLNYTHKGKIDVIYIDPPYNRGGDFVYNDRRIDKDDGYKHSLWLNFMEKRLKLAKELLSDSGILMISIDDFEYANLKLLCDKIFGENFVDTMIWRKSGEGRDGKMKNTSTFRKDHEYVIFCFKTNKLNKLREKPEFVNTYNNPDNDPRGNYKAGSISRKEAASNPNHPNYYSVTSPSGKVFTRQFDMPKEEFDKLNNDILINSNGKSVSRIYWGKNDNAVPSIKIFTEEERYVTPFSLLLNKGTTTEGTKEVSSILAKDCSAMRPKPTSLIIPLIQLTSKDNSIILDFFAGTGTTAHACLKANKKFLGNRKFIICTNNEGNIATDVCYPRVQKVIQGYNKNGNEEFIEGLGGNLKYFKTDFIANSKNKTQTKINLAKQCSEMLCLKTGIYNPIDEENPSFKLFDNNEHNKFLCVYFDFFGNNIQEFIHKIKTLNGEKFVFMFSLDENVDKSLFEGIENIKIEPIPQKILDVYKKIAKEHIKEDNHD